MTERCAHGEHNLTVTCDDDYAATCSRCQMELPCEDCAWASFCCLLWGECKKFCDESGITEALSAKRSED